MCLSWLKKIFCKKEGCCEKKQEGIKQSAASEPKNEQEKSNKIVKCMQF